MKEVKQPR
jgi:hypothetical protein